MDQSTTTQRPKNWRVGSILVTFFCCPPFGIVGIINAANVNTKYDAGDMDGALRASADDGKWTKIGFWIGVALLVRCRTHRIGRWRCDPRDCRLGMTALSG